MSCKYQPRVIPEAKECNKCGEVKSLDEFSNHKCFWDNKQTQCKSCIQEHYAQEHVKKHKKEYNKEYRKGYYAENSHKIIEAARVRKQLKFSRTPSWADDSKIAAVYRDTRQRRKAGGNDCVDHFYPLQGKTVSGFNIHTNLYIIDSSLNDSKSNKHPEDFYGPEEYKRKLEELPK